MSRLYLKEIEVIPYSQIFSIGHRKVVHEVFLINHYFMTKINLFFSLKKKKNV